MISLSFLERGEIISSLLRSMVSKSSDFLCEIIMKKLSEEPPLTPPCQGEDRSRTEFLLSLNFERILGWGTKT
jgi:hypothetical protein